MINRKTFQLVYRKSSSSGATSAASVSQVHQKNVHSMQGHPQLPPQIFSLSLSLSLSCNAMTLAGDSRLMNKQTGDYAASVRVRVRNPMPNPHQNCWVNNLQVPSTHLSHHSAPPRQHSSVNCVRDLSLPRRVHRVHTDGQE